MAERYLIDFPTPISYSTSNTLGGLSPTVKALLMGDGQQYANARPKRRSMFAMKPEMEIWPCAGCFPFVGESTHLSMVSDKIVRISSETAEIWRVKRGHTAQNGIACKNSKSRQVSEENQKKNLSRQNMPKRVEMV